MSVPSVNLRVDKGTDFEYTFSVLNADETPFDLTNYTATAKIRKNPGSTSSISFTTPGSLDSTGQIKIEMSAENTATLKSGINVYDLLITNTGTSKVTKVYEGNITVYDTSTL